MRKKKNEEHLFFHSQVDCLATSTGVSDENKTHTINDYYCNFVLIKHKYERRETQKMHILIGAHNSSTSC